MLIYLKFSILFHHGFRLVYLKVAKKRSANGG